uniref:Uncharacterized protein n=1 Tax=Anopheles darlingi TaxID=43151 RepID=A0A2M4D2N0_ANODA
MRCWRASSSSCSLNCPPLASRPAASGVFPAMALGAPCQAEPTSHHLPRSGMLTMSSSPMFIVDTYFPFVIMPFSSFRKCSTNVGSYAGILCMLLFFTASNVSSMNLTRVSFLNSSGAFAAFFCMVTIKSFSASGSSLRRMKPIVRSTSRMHSTAFSLKHSSSFCNISYTSLPLTMSNVYRWHRICTQLSNCFASFSSVAIVWRRARKRSTTVSRKCEPTSLPTLACSMATSSICSSTIRSGMRVGATSTSSSKLVSVLFISNRAFCMYRLSSSIDMRWTFDSANRFT